MSNWKIVVPTYTKNHVRNPSGEESEVVGSELLTYTGFETAGAGDPDFFEGWTEAAGDGSIVDSAIANGGTHACKLTSGVTSNTYVSQTVTVVPGRLYRASFYTRGTGTYSGQYKIYDVTNAVNIVTTTTTTVPGVVYTYKERCFVAPALCVSVTLFLQCPATNTAGAYFDDISIKEVNAGTPNLADAADLTRISTAGYSAFGVYSYVVTTLIDNEGAVFALSALSNAAHYLTMWVRGSSRPAVWDVSLDNSTYTAPTKIYDLDANWDLYGCAFPAAQANGSTALYVRQSGAGAGTLYIDAIQVELGTTWTTTCDGDQEGCEWLGAEHNSASCRSAVSRAGGTVYDLEDDYGVIVESYLGLGMAPRSTTQSGYAGQAGGSLNNSVRTSRAFTLVGFIHSTSYADLLDKRNALIDVLSPEAYPATADGWQPVLFWHTGGTTAKMCRAHYEAGLEIDHTWQLPVNERVGMRFLAPDPNWYELGESAQVLDYYDGQNFDYLCGRPKSSGKWDDIGMTDAPDGGGTVRTICVARDHSVYFGGDFTGHDSVVGRDYIARYYPATDTWETVGGDSAINSIVYVIKEGPDGTIYVGGSFVAAGGDGDADYLATYTPSTNTWAAVGIPDAGAATINYVGALEWDSSGNLYVGGAFTDFANVAAADWIAKWTGAAWAAVGAGGTFPVAAIAIDADDNIFIGGEFENWAADANADFWAWWNGTAWAAVDDIALSAAVQVMTFDPSGVLYVGGAFTNADSVAEADYIFAWTGTAVEALDTGTNSGVNTIVVAPDGKLYVSGQFTTAGSLSLTDRIAVWNGSTWLPLDANLPGAPTVWAIGFGDPDPTVPENYDIYLGFTTAGLAYYGGDDTVTNAGTAPVYPQIHVKRSIGTSARLVSVRSNTIGKELSCDYSLLDGEELTIDLHPDRQTVVSSFFGPRPDAVLAGSDLGSFALLPGANTITTFVDTAGTPTITAYMLWKDAYDGIDD